MEHVIHEQKVSDLLYSQSGDMPKQGIATQIKLAAQIRHKGQAEWHGQLFHFNFVLLQQLHTQIFCLARQRMVIFEAQTSTRALQAF